MTKDIIVRMGYSIQEFLTENNLYDAKPKDLMEHLVSKGFFKKDHREGLPLRNILRELDDKDELYLLPQVRLERNDVNRSWFFNVLKV